MAIPEVTLEQLVQQMQETARRHLHNQDRQFIAPTQCNRRVRFEGAEYDVMLTLNSWDSTKRKCWQLSVSSTNGEPVSDQVCRRLAGAFLGTGYQELQFPREMLEAMEPAVKEVIATGRQRQFMKEAK